MEMHVMTIQINNLSRSILWTFDQLDNTKADNLQESLNDTTQQFVAEKYNKLHFLCRREQKMEGGIVWRWQEKKLAGLNLNVS